MGALSDLLSNAAATKGWTGREVARRARKAGYQVSDATATAVLSGREARPKERTLEALATVLGVSVRDARLAGGLSAEPGEPWVPPAASRNLDADQRRVLDELVRVMARRSRDEEVVGDAKQPAPIDTNHPHPDQPPVQVAPDPHLKLHHTGWNTGEATTDTGPAPGGGVVPTNPSSGTSTPRPGGDGEAGSEDDRDERGHNA